MKNGSCFLEKKSHQLNQFLLYMHWPTTYEYFSWGNTDRVPGLDMFYVLPGSIRLTLIWSTSMSELGGPPGPLDSGPSFSFQTSLSLLCLYKHHPPPLLLQGRANLSAVSAGGAVWLHPPDGAFTWEPGTYWDWRGAGWWLADVPTESVPLDFHSVCSCCLHVSNCKAGVVLWARAGCWC